MVKAICRRVHNRRRIDRARKAEQKIYDQYIRLCADKQLDTARAQTLLKRLSTVNEYIINLHDGRR